MEILQQIQQNQYITQRDLAKNTGMSLGAINLVLKNMIVKGLIRIEKLSPKKIRYILTPDGMAQSIVNTYNYMLKSYKNISYMQNIIITFLNNQCNINIKMIYLFGDEDEIFKILDMILKKAISNISYTRLNNIEGIDMSIENVVLTWNSKFKDILDKNNIANFNILEYMI